MSADSPSTVELAETVSSLLSAIASWLLVGFGLVGVVAAVLQSVGDGAVTNPVASTVLFVVSMLFVAFGVYVNPRFRRRLERRHSVTRFGRARRVDRRVFRASEGRTERCVVCGARTDEGLVRRYRETVCLAGVPVWTGSEGHNYYCPDCAVAELPDAPEEAGTREHETEPTAEQA